MEKKYRLLKDLPGVEKDTIFERIDDEDMPERARGCSLYSPLGTWLPSFIESKMIHPWFDEVIPESYTKEDMACYASWCCVNHMKTGAPSLTIENWLKTK